MMGTEHVHRATTNAPTILGVPRLLEGAASQADGGPPPPCLEGVSYQPRGHLGRHANAGMSGLESPVSAHGRALSFASHRDVSFARSRRGQAEGLPQWVEDVLVKPVKQADLAAVLPGIQAIRSLVPARRSIASSLAPPRNLRVLVVEDHPLNREVMKDLLDSLGCSCDLAVDGADGLQKLELNPYAVVLMDCQMPGVDGYEATRASAAASSRTIDRECRSLPSPRMHCRRAGKVLQAGRMTFDQADPAGPTQQALRKWGAPGQLATRRGPARLKCASAVLRTRRTK